MWIMQDRQEYEDAAEILRHDLSDAQKRISELKSIIANRNNGDIDRLTQECARLTDRVRLLFVLFCLTNMSLFDCLLNMVDCQIT